MTRPAVGVEPRIVMDSEVTRRIRRHARAHFRTEVCGVLIGESGDGSIEIRASIEALHAAQAGTHVTFTQDAWEEIYKVKDELYPEERIVGWYHSHPGFGIFLSEHDLFIQENFFSSPGQVAWVYDPHSDEEGCFGWVAGAVHRLSSVAIAYKDGDGVEHRTEGNGGTLSAQDEEEQESSSAAPLAKPRQTPAWVRWTRGLLTHGLALLAGFAIAYLLFPRVLALMVDPATGELVIRDGRPLLPYLDQHIALPGRSAPPAALPSPLTAPAQPVTPRSPQ